MDLNGQFRDTSSGWSLDVHVHHPGISAMSVLLRFAALSRPIPLTRWDSSVSSFPWKSRMVRCSIDPSALAARTTGLQFQEKVLRSYASTLSQENQLWSGSWSNFLWNPEATSWKAGFSKSHHNSKRFTIYFLEKQLQPIYYQNDSPTTHDLI